MGLFRRHPVREDALSGYVDGALSAAELSRVEAHLETCERCRGAVEELRAVRGALQELPREHAPRSFALRRADIEAPRQAMPSGALRASPMLGAVATIALLAFFSLVGLDVAAGPGGANDEASRPGTASLELADDGAEPAAESPDGGGPQTDGEERGTDMGFALPGESDQGAEPTNAAALSVDAAEATEPAPLPATGGELDAAEEEDGRTGLRAAEAATAAVAVVAGGTFALAWRRRRV